MLQELTGRKIVDVVAKKTNDGKKQFFIEWVDLFKVQGRKSLVVEDIFTTGQSAARVVNFLKENGSEVVGVGGVWNRGGVTAEDLGVNVFYFSD